MNHIFAIAKSTLKAEIRDRIIYGILIFGILYIFLTLFLGDLVLHELPMVKSFGLAGIYFFNAIIALFLGTTSFYKDVERKTVYFILAKPVSRAQFLLGKFFGLCLVLLITSAIMSVGYLAVILREGGGFDVMGLAAIGMQFLEMTLFLSFAVFVSTFSTSLLSIVYTSGIFFMGHVVSQLVTDATAIGIAGWKLILVKILYYVFPNLEKFDIRNFAVSQVPFPFTSFVLALCYVIAYAALLLTAAIWVFESKEI